MNTPPLVMVLAQIRFGAVLKMANFVPDIQDKLRAMGLTRYSPESIQQVVFEPGELRTMDSSRWVFSNRAKTEAVVLAPDFFVYEVSKYGVFAEFKDRLLQLFAPVRDILSLSFGTQVGLRYVDLIEPTANYQLAEMLAPTIRGLPNELLAARSMSFQFYIESQTDAGTLNIRSFENTEDQYLPPDLQTPHLEFRKTLGGEYRILDFDHISWQEVDLNDEALAGRLSMLHFGTKKAFRSAVTDDALREWGTQNETK